MIAKGSYSPIIFLDVPKKELFHRCIKRSRKRAGEKNFPEKIKNEKILGIEETKKMADYNVNSINRSDVLLDIDKIVHYYFNNVDGKNNES